MKTRQTLNVIRFFNLLKGLQVTTIAIMMFLTIGLFIIIQTHTAFAGLAAVPTKTKAVKTTTVKIPTTPKTSPTSGSTAPSAQPIMNPVKAVQQQPASLKIGPLGLSPVSGGGSVPVIQLGSMVTLSFSIENIGIGKVPPGATYSLTGATLSGSNICPLASSSGPVPTLAPGTSKSYTFIGITGAKSGTYRLSVTTSMGTQKKSTHVDFTVPMPTVTPKPKPTPKTVPTVEQTTPVSVKKTIVQPLAPLKPALKLTPGSPKIIKKPKTAVEFHESSGSPNDPDPGLPKLKKKKKTFIPVTQVLKAPVGAEAAPSTNAASQMNSTAMMDALDKIPPVLTINSITPLGVAVHFNISASKPAGTQAGLKLRLFTTEPTAGGSNYCEEYTNNFLGEIFTFEQVTQWSPQFNNLITPETQLYYTLCTTGNTSYDTVKKVGVFNTGIDPNAPVLGLDQTDKSMKKSKAEMIEEFIAEQKANAAKLTVDVKGYSNKAVFQITSDKPVTQRLRMFTSPIPAGKECDETGSFPAFKAMSSFGEKTNWGTTFLNLPPQTNFWCEVCVMDDHMNYSRVTRSFMTRDRIVKVELKQITLHDDSDDLSAGDIKVLFRVNGDQHASYYPDGAVDSWASGETKQFNNTWNIQGPPDHILVEIRLGDCDYEFCDWGGPGNYHPYEDWGLVEMNINTTIGNETEEVKDYVWTSSDHGVSFTAYVTVTVKQQGSDGWN